MLRVNISITNISAERFWDVGKPLPQIKVNTNLNLIDVKRKTDILLEVPFVLTIGYSPSIAQMSLKGKAYVSGSQNELEKIFKDYELKKPPPQVIVQSISNIVFMESVMVSKTLNIPPPIPLPQIPLKSPNAKYKLDYST